MYMKDINNTNYDNDNRQYLAGFLEYLSKKKEGKKSEIDTYKIQEPIEILPFNKNVTSRIKFFIQHSWLQYKIYYQNMYNMQ